MTEKEKTQTSWPENFFSPEELEEFKEIEKTFPPEKMYEYQKRWAQLIQEIKENLHLQPEDYKAQLLAERWEKLLFEGYGGHQELLEKVIRAYNQSAIPQEYNLINDQVWEFIKKVKAVKKENL